jgi:hypothetical protein
MPLSLVGSVQEGTPDAVTVELDVHSGGVPAAHTAPSPGQDCGAVLDPMAQVPGTATH